MRPAAQLFNPHRSQDQILAWKDQNAAQTGHSLTSKTKAESTLVLKQCSGSLLNRLKPHFFLPRKIKRCVSSYRKVESLLPRSQVISSLLPLPCCVSNPESKLFSKNYLLRTRVLILFRLFHHFTYVLTPLTTLVQPHQHHEETVKVISHHSR